MQFERILFVKHRVKPVSVSNCRCYIGQDLKNNNLSEQKGKTCKRENKKVWKKMFKSLKKWADVESQ